MSGRYQPVGGQDEELVTDGDAFFTGVDMRQEPDILQPGTCSEALNKVFVQGVAETRKAFQTAPWMHLLGASFPWNFDIDFTEPVGFGEIFGRGEYGDPFGNRWAIIATRNVAWQIHENALPSAILYPEDVVIEAPVTFTQAFNVLLMWRGEDLNPFQLITTQEFEQDALRFEEVPDETNANYTSTIPDADRGLHYGNRVWVHFDRDIIGYSDILEYTRYDDTLSTIWVNEGESDSTQRLFPGGQNAIIAFKDRSIYALEGILPAPGENSSVRKLTGQHGAISPEAITQVGKDVWFLSDDGIYTITQVLDNELQAGSEPVSAPMDRLFRRINWAFAPGATAGYNDQRYYLALPIDGSMTNNVIVVFDLVAGQWMGHWTFPWGTDIKWFLPVIVEGKERLCIVSGPTQGGVLYLLSDSFIDQRFDEQESIHDYIVTRGYSANITDEKQWIDYDANLSTWYGAGSVTDVRDGANETGTPARFIKDRTRYTVHGKGRYDAESNENHGDPFREDYSVQLFSIAFPWNFPIDWHHIAIEHEVQLGQDFPLEFPLEFSEILGTQLEIHQFSSEKGRTREKGRHIQLKVEGTRGRVNVHQTTVRGRVRALASRMRT